MRRGLENMLALVAKVGADAAADRGPALGEVAEQARASAVRRGIPGIVTAHIGTKPLAGG